MEWVALNNHTQAQENSSYEDYLKAFKLQHSFTDAPPTKLAI